MEIVETIRARLSRRVGPSFAAMAIAANVAYGYPDGWGTSPRRAPYRPRHTSPPTATTPGTPVLDNAKQAR